MSDIESGTKPNGTTYVVYDAVATIHPYLVRCAGLYLWGSYDDIRVGRVVLATFTNEETARHAALRVTLSSEIHHLRVVKPEDCPLRGLVDEPTRLKNSNIAHLMSPSPV